MVGAVAGESVAGDSIDRLQQLRMPNESKAGVKGLVNSGVTRIPPIFVIPPEDISGIETSPGKLTQTQFAIPIVNLGDMESRCRGRSPEGCRDGGVFPGGIPVRVLEMML